MAPRSPWNMKMTGDKGEGFISSGGYRDYRGLRSCRRKEACIAFTAFSAFNHFFMAFFIILR
jgi:hypothetical protein